MHLTPGSIALLSGATLFVLASLALGVVVSTSEPAFVDMAAARRLYAKQQPLAEALTRLGYLVPLLAILIVLAAASLIWNHGRLAVLYLAASQASSQLIVRALKSLYRRVRPEQWLFIQEFTPAYPSGHAVTALVFFGGLVVFAFASNLPDAPKLAALWVGTACIAGIGWSRVALGAHHLTDVLGGYLFGCGWLMASLAFAPALESIHLP